MSFIMHKQRLCSIQPATLISPHRRGFPCAVGAYVLLHLAVAFEHLCGLPHVLVNSLSCPVLFPVCTVLPDVKPPGLCQHPGA